jgi:23S rRNA (guanosine2251-2'-O)-methyltransferase
VADRVIGRIPVLECLRAGKRPARRLFVLDGARGLEDILAAASGIEVDSRSRRDLDAMVDGETHQGVILEAEALPLHDLDAWLARLKDRPDAVAVLLDGIEDPHNLGAIVRSAAACGAAGVIFAKDRSAPLSSIAMKSAAGAMEHIDLVRVTNLARSIETMQSAGFWISALDAEGDQNLWDANLTGRTGIVIGSEGKGVRRLVAEKCDLLLRIPIEGPITSLNASVSAGIALTECLRQRVKPNASAPGG